jgi:alpha-ketoglutaric semialdehyde dehydrogenase
MIVGKQFIGFEQSGEGTDILKSVNPGTGETLAQFSKATPAEVDRAVAKAATAFQIYRKKSGAEKAAFLEAAAAEIVALGDELVNICCAESGLPQARIQGEVGRTAGQLRLFATLLKEGSWVDARIETAIPDRAPLPKPDIRYMQIGLGPVVVFGASNFPLAFSAAGGDTASALAAGCPVIVKAHSAHPATSSLVAGAVIKAAQATGMPDGVFSLIFGDGSTAGTQLVKHPEVKAVGFTGSYSGGKALFDAAVSRPVPIPVYAEMGSTNPVFILPETAKSQAEAFAKGFSGSVTLGVGQFCTNPGMLIYEAENGKELTAQLETQFAQTAGNVMLTSGIYKAYNQGVDHHLSIAGVETLAKGAQSDALNTASPILFKTNSQVLGDNPQLSEEIFGPTSLVVEAQSKEDILNIARNLTGHLTATVHGTEKDLEDYKDLLDILEQKVGRIVINGFPTGVEVCHAMVHGGPFPSTTDGRSTSVGTAAIERFTRPVSYQGLPQSLLPDELKNSNPLGIWRLVNGTTTNGTL